MLCVKLITHTTYTTKKILLSTNYTDSRSNTTAPSPHVQEVIGKTNESYKIQLFIFFVYASILAEF